MKVSSLWAGEDYAYQHYKGTRDFPMHAQKGKCIKVEKVKAYGKERESAFALMEREDGTTERVRVRDVHDFWEDYENERRVLLKQQEERQERIRLEREARNREYEERQNLRRREEELARQRAAEQQNKLIDALIARTDMPRELISTVSQTTVCLDRTALEFWLSVQSS